MMIETFIVDSFTHEIFKGNPAGVCLLDQDLDENSMLKIAQELNLSETAFVVKNEKRYSIRYFSPVMEIPLCGHATLAAAEVVFHKYQSVEIDFITFSGIHLPVYHKGDEIQMTFPIYTLTDDVVSDELLTAIGIKEVIDVKFNQETNILMLVVQDAQLIEKLAPDFVRLKKANDHINGVLITASTEREGYDYESRYFWPWSGTNEDPVTGGIQTFLAKYWADKLGRKKLNTFQSSSRSGHMSVEVMDNQTVLLSSTARIVFSGALHL